MAAVEPVLPDYAGRVLGNLLPAVAAGLGLPDWGDPFGLPAARRYVVLLADGLGWELLFRHLDRAETLAQAADRAIKLTCGAPSTTVTSLSSFGTGLAPGQHGLVGYRFWAAEQSRGVGPLAWDWSLSPRRAQPAATVFERVAAAGLTAARVLPGDHAESKFSQAVLRGGLALGFAEADDDDLAAQVVGAVQAGPSGLVYCYDRSLDHAGHLAGVASTGWLDALAGLDRRVARLRRALPDDVVLLLTADHGMVDVPELGRLWIEDERGLRADLSYVAGEPRFRHLHTNRPQAVAQRWRDRFGPAAWVRTREEAIAEGWFGPTVPLARRRVGDVVVASGPDLALFTRRAAHEARLVGMHGSLTAAEMEIPLLVWSP
ncbi:MAG: alkaline phosphatase family protein [Propionibacteriaceae bacterium]|jgi:hypothetical protein|nr:alkaline phosphatase family protein [Propionibacteriaceae bacterium]